MKAEYFMTYRNVLNNIFYSSKIIPENFWWSDLKFIVILLPITDKNIIENQTMTLRITQKNFS